MQGAKKMHIKRTCDCELPRQSLRLSRACVDFFVISPQGAALSHKQKVQGKASALCYFAVLICAACVCRGVVNVVALFDLGLALVLFGAPAQRKCEMRWDS
jgi:hypothetical protein